MIVTLLSILTIQKSIPPVLAEEMAEVLPEQEHPEYFDGRLVTKPK